MLAAFRPGPRSRCPWSQGGSRRTRSPSSAGGSLAVERGRAARRALRAGDILLSIDGRSIGTDGTIELRPRERTAFTFLLQRRQMGDQVASLAHLIEVIESRDAGLLVLETHEGKQVVLDRERAQREGPAILARYQVPSDRSEDLVAATGRGSTRTVAASVALPR
jgi:hypothetical protein